MNDHQYTTAMKALTIFLFVIISTFMNELLAQEQISVQPSQMTLNTGNAPAYKVFIPQALQPKVMKEWGKLLISETGRKERQKPVMSKADYAIDSIFIKKIAEEPLNVNSTFMQKENGVEMVSAFKLKGQYIDSANSVLKERTENFIKNFAVEQYREAVKEELENEQSKLERLNEQLDQLVKENTRYKKDISSYNNDTLDLKQDIVLQNNLKEVKDKEILQQEINLSRAKNDPVNYKEQKKKLSTMKHERKQMSNKIEKNERQIVSIVSDIESSRRKIVLNDQEQEKQRQAIESQMTFIEQVKEKLSKIK